MRPVYETCRLRPEVLTGELKEAVFAARLTPVVQGRADPVYGDPVTFFSRTYPTSGLKRLLAEALGRLTGSEPTAAPIIRLETGFGGGKTHNLITLYHACSGRTPREVLNRFVPEGTDVTEPIRIAAVVGEDLDPVNGVPHPDGITTYTLWGEIAYQLGGPEGYRIMEAADTSATVPGTHVWERLLGDGPALILLDELAPYLRMLLTSRDHAAGAGHLTAFLKSLLEVVSDLPRAAVVLSLAEASDAFGRESEEIARTLNEVLGELKSVSARKELSLTPAKGEEEIAAILVHRLFEQVAPKAAREAARAYQGYYDRLLRQEADIPPAAVRAEYAALLEQGYPFHPELLVVLNRKTSTIPNFQRTRGALRLLATALRRLWEVRSPDARLVHLHHLDLAVPRIAEDLTSRLDRPRYAQIVEADIVSGVPEAPAHAEEIDRKWREAEKPPLACKVATAVFLHSLTQGGGAGARPEEVNLAVLAPGDDPVLVTQALQALERFCWHLEAEGGRYLFKPEPSLNKMIADEAQFVGTAKTKEELDRRIRAIWQDGIFQVCRFPAEPADIPDDAGKPKLALVHYDAAAVRTEGETPPDLVRRLFTEAGTVGAVREYQNNVLFLVADEAQVSRLVQEGKYHLAVTRLATDSDRLESLTREQRRKLDELRGNSELQLRLAIHRTYRFLYYPSGDVPVRSGLAREVLPAQEQGDVKKDQSHVLLEALRRLDKAHTADDAPVAPEYLKHVAWTMGRPSVTPGDLRRAYARRRALRILFDPEPLKKGIREGITRGHWVYYDPAEGVGYGASSPPPLVRLDDDADLMEPEEAARRGIPIKGETVLPERCPVCGNPAPECVCAREEPEEEEVLLQAEGNVDQALQRLVDKMHDAGIPALRTLQISVSGDGREGAQELQSIGLAVPQMGSGGFNLEVKAAADFGTKEDLRLEFRGPWERYRRLKDVTDPLFRQAGRFHVNASLTIGFAAGEGSPDRLNGIREVLRTLNLGHIKAKAEPEDRP